MGADNAVSPSGGDKNADKDTLPRKELQNGPIYERSCTDLICCLIFCAFIVGMVGTSGYGYLHGDVQLLLTGWDADRNGCGYAETPETKDYPYLYFPSIDITSLQESSGEDLKPSDVLRFSTCVKECPTAKLEEPVNCKKPDFMTTEKGPENYKDCVYYIGGVDIKANGVSTGIAGLPLRYKTLTVGDKLCLPDPDQGGSEEIQKIVKSFEDQAKAFLSNSGADAYIADIMATRDLLGWAILSSFLIGFIYLIVLKFLGGIIIWASIFGIVLGTIFGGYMLWDTSEGMTEPKDEETKKYYLYGSYVVWGLGALMICCVLCNWKNIKIGIAVMKCTASFIGSTPQVFALPPLSTILVFAWFALWVIIALHIGSVGTPKPREDFPFLTEMEWSDNTRYVLLYSLFGFLWILNFIIGATQFIISATCAIWYFSSTSDANGTGSMSTGFYWVFRYHLGSIAFGSFLIALIQFIRIIFEYYADQLQKANKDNAVIKCLLCATRYLLDCLERFIKFITKNAYIQMAITGKNFCSSAWNAFLLIMKNALRFGTAASIGFIFNVLGVAFIASANGIAVYAALHYVPFFEGRASSWIAPCVIGFIEGLIVGTMFMSMFSFASDTILQAFLVDEDLNRGEGNRPAIMNQFIDGMKSQDKGEAAAE